MSRLTIIEGNSNDKDNVRVLIVKGPKGDDGVSPIVTTSKENGIATINVTDAEGTKSVSVEDGVSPTVATSKANGVTTITITDAEGTHTATINDGEVTNEALAAALADYVPKNDIKKTLASETMDAVTSGDYSRNLIIVPYPPGLNQDNCIILAVHIKIDGYNIIGAYGASPFNDIENGRVPVCAGLNTNGIFISFFNTEPNDVDYEYRLVLMKLPDSF